MMMTMVMVVLIDGMLMTILVIILVIIADVSHIPAVVQDDQ